MRHNNLIQFARFICEINATQAHLDCDALCLEMDIDDDELDALFEQAHIVWETYKLEGGQS
jgi:hypothetical protein|tara:strand:+ start:2173 stop:2355 length:183 start_codon:yes stop_codon:yes gene_type:complete